MKKVLLLASVAPMIDKFNRNNISLLQDLGYEVHVATNFIQADTVAQARNLKLQADLDGLGVMWHQVDFARSPFNLKNIRATKQLFKLLKTHQYQLLHAHSPIGGVLGRLLGKIAGVPRLMYTAHGFHFHQQASKLNWLIFFPIEWLLSFLTTDLITINEEDSRFAARHLHAKRQHKINGIGVNLDRFSRTQQGLEPKAAPSQIHLMSIGELNANKNHRMVIEAIHQSVYKSQFIYRICGEGDLQNELQDLINQYDLSEQVQLLGFRDDIDQLLKETEIFVFPSYREGLPVSVMEAMAAGLPVLASNIRGNVDLIDHGQGGFLFKRGYLESLLANLNAMVEQRDQLPDFGQYNRQKVKLFGEAHVNRQMREIYLAKEPIS